MTPCEGWGFRDQCCHSEKAMYTRSIHGQALAVTHARDIQLVAQPNLLYEQVRVGDPCD